MAVEITQEMKEAAQREAIRRNPYIRHHFEVGHMTPEQRDVIGFIGEFACKTLFGIPWQADVREDYLQIDSGDIILPGLTIDVKTETVPLSTLLKLVKGQIPDDKPYGRRLINEGQIRLLEHYDYVMWGAVARENPKCWFALGFLETQFIRSHYPEAVTATPFGSRYPDPCLNIRHSELKNPMQLQRIIDAHR